MAVPCIQPNACKTSAGTALTIELARLFSQSGVDFDATLDART